MPSSRPSSKLKSPELTQSPPTRGGRQIAGLYLLSTSTTSINYILGLSFDRYLCCRNKRPKKKVLSLQVLHCAGEIARGFFGVARFMVDVDGSYGLCCFIHLTWEELPNEP